MTIHEKTLENLNLMELTQEWRELQAILETAADEEIDTLDLNLFLSKINDARLVKISNCLKLYIPDDIHT